MKFICIRNMIMTSVVVPSSDYECLPYPGACARTIVYAVKGHYYNKYNLSNANSLSVDSLYVLDNYHHNHYYTTAVCVLAIDLDCLTCTVYFVVAITENT